MTDELENDQIETNTQGKPEPDFIPEKDPMIEDMKAAEAELAGKGDEEAAPTAQADAEPAAKDAPMIPKARLDAVLAERDRTKEALTYTQGIVDTQKALIADLGKKVTPAAGDQPSQDAAVPDPNDHAAIIAKAEDDKIALAQKYEDGEISLVELRKQEIALDRQIRDTESKRTDGLVESAKTVASEAVKTSNVQNRIEQEALEIQKQHPYIKEIDLLPAPIRAGIWGQITNEALANLALKGTPYDEKNPETHIALMAEKAALTNKYGPQYTGKQLASPTTKTPAAPSETAIQRAKKLEMAADQPPVVTGTTVDKKDLTEADVENMSDDEMADYLQSAPGIVLRAAGFKN